MTQTFNDVLTSPQLALLHAGHYEGAQQASFFSGRIVFAGQVTQDLSLQTTWIQFSYGSVSAGAYTAVEQNQTIIIGTTNDLVYSAKVERLWRGRCRTVADASNIYTNISSVNVPNGAFFWVLDQWEILGVLSRAIPPDPATAIQYVDSTEPYLPLSPRVTGLRTMYVGNTDDITGQLRIALSITAYPEESGASITAYLWSFRSGVATVISGSVTTPTVTVDINPSACATWGETWGTLTVTSTATNLTRKFGIKVHDASHPPTVGFQNMQVKGAYDGSSAYSATLPGFAGIDDILPGTPAIIWRSDEMYGATPGSLTGDNIDFVGWLQNESGNLKGDAVYSNLADATFQLAGVGARLAYLAMQLLIIINDSSPALWDHMIDACPRRTIWHILTRHSTAALLSDIAFDDDLSSEDYTFPYLPLTGKNLSDIPNAVLAQVNAALEFAPDGRILACRDAQYIGTTEQASVPIIANWTGQDGFVVAVGVTYDNSIGVVDADGAAWDAGHTNVTAFASRAPGIAQGESQGSSTLANQILIVGSAPNDAQAELNARSGTFYEVTNLVEELTVDHPDGYNFIIPSRCQLYTWTLDTALVGDNNVQRIIYDTSTLWYVRSVDFTHDNDKGTRKVRVVYHRVTFSTSPGDTVPIPPPTVFTLPPLPPLPFPALPDLPPFPDSGLLPAQLPPGALAPPPGKLTGASGGTLIEASATNAYVTSSFLPLISPVWFGVTPTDLGAYTIRQVLFDPFGPASNTCGAYLLASDGTHSAVWWTANVLQRPPVWTQGASVSGEYTIIRARNVPGAVDIYTLTGSGSSVDETLTISRTSLTSVPTSFSTILGQNYTLTISGTGNWIGGFPYQSDAFYADNNTGMPWPRINVSATCDSDGIIQLIVDGDVFPAVPTFTGSHIYVVTLTGTGSPFVFAYCDSTYTDNSGTHSVRVQGSLGATPDVRTSADYGATLSATVAVSGVSSATVGGYDVSLGGTVSYAAGNGAVYKATTIGGSYASWYSISGGANAVCLIVPWYKRNSTSSLNTTTSTPDVVAVLDDGRILWLDGATATATNITPSGSTAADNANCFTCSFGTHLAVFILKSGVYHWLTSTNGGSSWTDHISLTSPHFARTRRNDATARPGGNHGQLFLAVDNFLDYSSTWDAVGMSPHNIPNSAALSMDIYG